MKKKGIKNSSEKEKLIHLQENINIIENKIANYYPKYKPYIIEKKNS